MKKLITIIITALALTACGSNLNTMSTTPEKGDTVAVLKTSEGDISLLIYTKHVPETAKNFLEHAKEGRYDGVPFHRVIDEFMIQTGDFENQNGTGGYSYKGPGTNLEDEFHDALTHIRGAVSMANAGPNTGGSQFFIVNKEDGTDWLDGKHAIFGYAFEGMDVVDAIAAAEKDYMDRPVEPILIETVEISEWE